VLCGMEGGEGRGADRIGLCGEGGEGEVLWMSVGSKGFIQGTGVS
jgi:hypothetical protein